jgi:DNA-binding transcriptional LysR family regulator
MADSIANHDLPLGMEVRHLAALDAVARTRSFSQAAIELGYAQSAISQQIATLERSVGHRLVERPGGPRPVSLTPAGELLLGHAAHITARLGAAKADLDALAAGTAGSVRVGIFQSAGARLLPRTLLTYRERWPQVDVQLHNELACEQLDELVHAGRLDLAYSDITNLGHALAYEELLVDDYVAVVPPDSPLAGRGEIELDELDDVPIVCGSLQDACGVRVATAFEDARSRPRILFRTDDNLTMQRLVATGLCCAVMASMAVERNVPDASVAICPLGPRTTFSRRIGIVWHRDRYRSPAAASFVDTARDVVAGLRLPPARAGVAGGPTQ